MSGIREHVHQSGLLVEQMSRWPGNTVRHVTGRGAALWRVHTAGHLLARQTEPHTAQRLRAMGRREVTEGLGGGGGEVLA